MDKHRENMIRAEKLRQRILEAVKSTRQLTEATQKRADEARQNPCHHDTPPESKEVTVHAEENG